jgi:hypothetical protein
VLARSQWPLAALTSGVLLATSAIKDIAVLKCLKHHSLTATLTLWF